MVVTSYLTVAGTGEVEIEVKRSRFRCHLERVENEDAARAVVEHARREHWDARHHCSAFVLGADGSTQRSSDDGEPAGTAGAPMLEVLRGREVSDVVAVVTRWFGGTLLGAGGLVRAYGDAVRAALAGVTGVASVHDLHVWTVSSGVVALSAHAVVPDLARHDAALRAMDATVRRLGINHVTSQIERADLDECVPPGDPAGARDCTAVAAA